ncbi:MAG: flippase-like domain-containing protein [Firmicutes bacterium]|nr:flippase-like domain-containing protein [Bacillota bacterium]
MAKDENLQSDAGENLITNVIERKVVDPSLVLDVGESQVHEEEAVSRKITHAEKYSQKQKSKKSKALSIGFVLLNVAIVGILFYLNIDNLEPLDTVITSNRSLFYLIAGCSAFLLLAIASEGFRFCQLLFSAGGGFHPKMSVKAHIFDKYYNYITPGGFGGMPFQIYFIYSRGVSGNLSSSVPTSYYVSQRIGFFIFAITVICLFGKLIDFNGIIIATTIVGLLFTSIAITAVLFIGLNKKAVKRITAWVIKVLHKMRLIKNYNATLKKSLYTIYDYQKTATSLFRKPVVAVTNVAAAIFSLVCNAMVIFCIHSAFFGVDFSLFGLILISYCLIELIMIWVPLPGGSGGAEWGFSVLLLGIFGLGTIAWAILFWRIFHYFAYLVIGLLLLIYENLHGRERYKRRTRKTV